MINGMYLSTMGAMVQMARQDIIANNLANTNTTGYKPDFTIFQAVPAESERQAGHRREIDTVLEKTGGGVWLHQTATNFQPGPLRVTGNVLDLVLQDENDSHVSFFMVRQAGADGETRYTRDGNFLINQARQLANSAGALVLSADGGPIEIPQNVFDLNISAIGTITAKVDGETVQVGQVGVVRLRKENLAALEKIGGNLYGIREGQAPDFNNSQAGVKSGYLEESVANSITEMTNMIEGHRTYEANMAFLKIQDQTLGDVVQRLGSVA